MRFIDFNFYYCYNGFVWHLGNIRFLEFEFSAPTVREDIGCFLLIIRKNIRNFGMNMHNVFGNSLSLRQIFRISKG